MLDFSSCPTSGGKGLSGVTADKKFWSHLAMPIVNRIAEFEPELIEWRHQLHSFPELGFEEYHIELLKAYAKSDTSQHRRLATMTL